MTGPAENRTVRSRAGQFLVCRQRASYYAFANEALVAVAPPARITPLPFASTSRFLGVANIRGRATLIADLNVLLGGTGSEAGGPGAPATEEQKRRVVVVRHDALETGLLVDEVLQFVPSSAVELRTDVIGLGEFVDHVFLWNTWVVSCLNLPRLMQSGAAEVMPEAQG